jgi:replicative DNA helicase
MSAIKDFDSLLLKHKDFRFESVFSKQRMYEVYEEYAKNISDKKLYMGFDTIDTALGGLRPSEVVSVIAGTNIGKSAFAMNIMYNITQRSDGLVILFSLEMSETDIFERYIQMQLDCYTSEVENIFIKNDPVKKDAIKEIMQKHKNIYSVIKRINIDEVTPYVLAIQEMEKKECVMVLIDHLGLIKNDRYKDDYSKTTDNMMKIKEIALHLKKPIFLLSQTSRQDIKSNEGLSLYSGKNSGEIENSSQIVFTLQKQKEIPAETVIDYETLRLIQEKRYDLLKLKCEKKKRGDAKDVDIIFNKKNLRMTEYFLNPPAFVQTEAF